jgi:hypothetical protein
MPIQFCEVFTLHQPDKETLTLFVVTETTEDGTTEKITSEKADSLIRCHFHNVLKFIESSKLPKMGVYAQPIKSLDINIIEKKALLIFDDNRPAFVQWSKTEYLTPSGRQRK